LFALVTRESGDRRNYVRKAVNWALRQIGKRNRALNQRAVAVARWPNLTTRPPAGSAPLRFAN
jgi:3-methyladenine DNA glycosylase AlkD